MGGIIGVVYCVTCPGIVLDGYNHTHDFCPRPSFSNFMSRANLYFDGDAGGLFGIIAYS